MANNLSTSISLTDNFTPQLRNISNALSTVSSTLNSLDFDKGFDSKALRDMTNASQQLDKSISELEKESDKAAKEQDKHNQSLKEGKSSADSLSGGFKGLVGAIGGVVATYASIEGIKSALDWSDTITQTTSRLNLVNESFNQINGSQQTTAELQDKIFQAAQASRGSYQDMQELVASLGNNARDAFSSTDEMVKFAESLNKTFAISGASAEEMSNATLQLTQGLASGALRGDELNSVLENAPELINVIANSMGVPRGEIRNLASEGKITAEVVKNALIGSSDEIDAKFQSMDTTFGQLWTQFTNTAQHAFEPVSAALTNLANSPEFQASLDTLSSTIADLAPKVADFVASIVSAAPTVLQGICNAFSWIVDHGDQIGFVLSTVGGALMAYQAYSFVSGVITAITAATEGMTIAQAALNVVLNANPIMLIVTAIGALIAAVVYLWNTNDGFRNAVISAWDAVVGAFQNAWNNISGVFSSLGAAWDEAIRSVQGFWSNLTATVSEWWNAAVSWGQNLIQSFLSGITTAWNNITTWFSDSFNWIVNTVTEWWNSANSWGMNLIQGFLGGLTAAWNNITTWFTDSFNWIVNSVKSIFGISSPSTVFSEIGGNLLAGLLGGLQAAWTNITTWFTDSFNWIVTNVKSIFGIASPSTVFNDIGGNLITGFLQGMQAMWESVTSWASQAWNSITKLFGGGGEEEGTSIDFTAANQQLDAFNNRVTVVFDEISQKSIVLGQTMVANITAGLGTLPEQMSAVFAVTMSQVQVQVQSIVAAAIQGFTALVPGIREVFMNVSAESTALLRSFSASASEIINGLIRSITEAAGGMAKSFVGTVSSMVAQTGEQFKQMSGQSLATVQAMAQGIIQRFTSMTSSLMSNFNSFNSSMVGALGSLASHFNSTFRNIQNSTVATLNQMHNAALQAVNRMVNDLGNAIRGLPDHFSYISNMMMSGFRSGIESQAQGVINTANSLVERLKATFQQDLGIHSPSDYMIWIGKMMLEGLKEGMPSSQIQDFVESVVKDMRTSFESGNYNTDKTTKFMGEQRSLGVVAEVTGMDLREVENAAPAVLPAIVQEASSNVGQQRHIRLEEPPTLEPRYDYSRLWNAGYPSLDTSQLLLAHEIQPTNPQFEQATLLNEKPIELELGTVNYENGSTRNDEAKNYPISVAAELAGLEGGYNVGNILAAALQNAYWDGHSPEPTKDISIGISQAVPETAAESDSPEISRGVYGLLSNACSELSYMAQQLENVSAIIRPKQGRSGQVGYANRANLAAPQFQWDGMGEPVLAQFTGGDIVYTSEESRSIMRGEPLSSTSSFVASGPGQVTVNVNVGTINNAEESIGTLEQFKNMFIQAIDDVIYKEPKGIVRG